jgi:hypothetical protein
MTIRSQPLPSAAGSDEPRNLICAKDSERGTGRAAVAKCRRLLARPTARPGLGQALYLTQPLSGGGVQCDRGLFV